MSTIDDSRRSITPEDRLALYHFPSCYFCVYVRDAIERLGLDVELRDIHADPGRWEELTAARGRPMVPVLRIESPDGEVRWMPESADIVRYLEATYGGSAADRDRAQPGFEIEPTQ